MVATGPMTVGQLEARLRKMIHRLGPRDRESVLLAIEAMQDLSKRLHDATTKPAALQPESYTFASTRPVCPACMHPLSSNVERDLSTVCPSCFRVWTLKGDLSAVREVSEATA